MPRDEDKKISEYVELLQEFKERFGDVVVVTPGFDETGCDPVAAPVLTELVDSGREYGHTGIYQYPEGQAAKAFKACLITF